MVSQIDKATEKNQDELRKTDHSENSNKVLAHNNTKNAAAIWPKMRLSK
jgi:hypothetical protein